MVGRIPNLAGMLIFPLMLIALGALGLYRYAPQAYPLFFSGVKGSSVPELLKVERTVAGPSIKSYWLGLMKNSNEKERLI